MYKDKDSPVIGQIGLALIVMALGFGWLACEAISSHFQVEELEQENRELKIRQEYYQRGVLDSQGEG